MLNDNVDVVYYVCVGDKEYGPYQTDVAASAVLQTLPLTEGEKIDARIVPKTTAGQQVLMEG